MKRLAEENMKTNTTSQNSKLKYTDLETFLNHNQK